MKSALHRKTLDHAVLLALTTLWPGSVVAQSMAETVPPAGMPASLAQCTGNVCMDGDVLLFELRTRSSDRPASGASEDERGAAALQPDRRVEVGLHLPGHAVARTVQSVELPAGGVVWASEDPALGTRALAVSLPAVVAFEAGALVVPLPIQVRSNYPDFIARQEVLIFRASDTDLGQPLVRIPIPVGAVSRTEWQGSLAVSGGAPLRQGDVLSYVLRAYGEDGQFDQTLPHTVQLVSEETSRQNRRALREQVQRLGDVSISEEQAQAASLVEAVFAESGLRHQNIPLRGSRVRIQGQDIAEGHVLRINGETYPVDSERKFAAEFLVPVGQHRFDVSVGEGESATEHPLHIDVDGRYAFGVGLADISAGRRSVSGSPFLLADAQGRVDDSLNRGRLAFYGKARFGGRYLLTAHADTTDQELDRLFSGFTDSTPEDLFRRLDPDLYYPVYGDDSTTWRDVDTQGRLYLRLDWDHSRLLWGNYNTRVAGSEFAQYQRALYGADLDWRSLSSTVWGEARTRLAVFAAQPDTVQGRSEFIGTGGSLYYLRHTDILPGSDSLTLQVRDRTTGRIEAQQMLQRGVDYEIDELQGRVILTVPLAQVTRRHLPMLSRDAALDGYDQVLLADYAWVPGVMASESTTVGGRASHWFGDHLAVGVTAVQEGRQAGDYRLEGADVTLKASAGTWLRAELARTESFGVPVYWSGNGGLDFRLRNELDARREGEARAVEGRINLQELGWTSGSWQAAAWWRDRDAGYSTGLYDSRVDVRETGVEMTGLLGAHWELYVRASRADAGTESLEQAQATVSWKPDERGMLSIEARQVDEIRGADSGAGTLLTARWLQQVGAASQWYVQGQKTLDDDHGHYRENDAVAVGGQWVLADRFTLGGDLNSGDRGDGYMLEADYRLRDGHSLYGGYAYSTDTVTPLLLRPSRTDNGWTLGQRWRVGQQAQVYSESQWMEQGGDAGLVHTFGLEFAPWSGWRSGITLSRGELDNGVSGQVERKAVSVSLGRTDARTDWSSKVEWRRDSGAEDREQWVSTHRVLHRLNEDWRLAARLNWSDTEDRWNPLADAQFIEANAGLAWRPHDGQRWALLSRLTYLYDLASPGQIGGATVDQKSAVGSLEGIYKYNQQWEFALKLARREGSMRMARGEGPWLDSATSFGAVQVRYDLWWSWHALAEYRVLDVDQGGQQQGALLALERDLGANLRLGAGYNFTDFSDDLTDFDYRQRGWFLSLTGMY